MTYSSPYLTPSLSPSPSVSPSFPPSLLPRVSHLSHFQIFFPRLSSFTLHCIFLSPHFHSPSVCFIFSFFPSVSFSGLSPFFIVSLALYPMFSPFPSSLPPHLLIFLPSHTYPFGLLSPTLTRMPFPSPTFLSLHSTRIPLAGPPPLSPRFLAASPSRPLSPQNGWPG